MSHLTEQRNYTRFLRLPEVKELTGLGRSTIYQMIKIGSFPKPFNLGPRSVGWIDSDIINWIQTRKPAQL